MEIKVGEWVRTKDGCIFKATDYWIYDCEVKTENIVSHSKNIIDLIEERRLCKWIQSRFYRWR